MARSYIKSVAAGASKFEASKFARPRRHGNNNSPNRNSPVRVMTGEQRQRNATYAKAQEEQRKKNMEARRLYHKIEAIKKQIRINKNENKLLAKAVEELRARQIKKGLNATRPRLFRKSIAGANNARASAAAANVNNANNLKNIFRFSKNSVEVGF